MCSLKRIILVSLFLFPVSQLYVAAQVTVATDTLGLVEGKIMDKDGTPMGGIALRVMTEKDSTLRTGGVTDSLGCYRLRGLAAGQYVMSYSMVGYQTGYVHFNLSSSHSKATLPNLRIEAADVILNAAVVTANMPPVTVQEDTIAYNADAYHAPEGSMVSDLIERIPGAEITDDGQLKINGKVYNKILINGKEYFSNDMQATLNNLPANIIKKVKVYDRKSEQARLTGIDDGVEDNVMDLEIKTNMFKGLSGQANAATGSHNRYSSSLNVNRFRSDSHLSLMAGMNNVNNPSFSEKGNNAVNFSKAGRPGLTASKGVGITYAKDKQKKYRISGDVRYNYSNAENQSSRHSETAYNDSNYRYNDNESWSVRCRNEFNMNFNLEWQPDTLTTIQLRPNFSYSKTNNWSTNDSESEKWDGRSEDDSVKINNRKARSSSSQEGSEESVDFSIFRRLSRAGRSITFNSSYNYKNYNSFSFTRSLSSYFLEPSRNRNYSRYTQGNNYSNGYNLGLSYNEPLFKGTTLQLQYNFSYRHGRTNRYGHELDFANGDSLFLDEAEVNWDSVAVDTLLSSCYENKYLSHNIHVNMRHTTSKMNLSYGINLNPRHNETNYLFGQKMSTGLITQNLMNWSPSFSFIYHFTKHTTLNFGYHGNSSEPNLNDLLEVIDKSNPQNIQYGNPALKPSFTNSLNMTFNVYGEDSHQSLVTNLSYSSTDNATENMSLYESSTGIKVSKLMNVNGAWNASANINFNSPIDAEERLTMSTESSANYNARTNYNSTPLTAKQLTNAGVTVDFQDIEPDDIDKLQSLALKNHTRTLRLRQSVSFRYRLSDVLFRLSGGVNYYKVTNSVQQSHSRETFDYNLKGNVQLDLPLDFQVNTNMNFTSRHGYSANIQKNIAMWNASVSKQFLKHHAGLLSFQIFDILHQRSNISRDISNLTITDTRSQVLRNYFLFAFQYRLNTMTHRKRDLLK